MNLQRMKQLAGIKLTEGVVAVPGVGQNSEANMQTAGTVGRNQAYAAYDAGTPQVTETAPPGMEDMVMKLKKQYPGHEEKAFATAWSIYNKKHGTQDEGMYEGLPNGEPPKVDPRTAERIRKQLDAAKWARHAEDDKRDKESGQGMYQTNESSETEESTNAYQRFKELVDSFVDPYDALDIVLADVTDPAGVGQYIKSTYEEEMQDQDTGDFGEIDRDDEFSAPDTQRNGGWDMHQDNDEIDGEFDEAFDMNNGYDDIDYANGDDFFPDGADSPVVSSVGPSGARHGDNPEQKRMQVAEVHKELVYGYRDYLKESKLAKKK